MRFVNRLLTIFVGQDAKKNGHLTDARCPLLYFLDVLRALAGAHIGFWVCTDLVDGEVGAQHFFLFRHLDTHNGF